MSSEGSRRFTDREVAIVLRKASEIEESVGSGASGALSLDDLKEIAKEVGISPEAINEAVAGLDRGRQVDPALWGAPLVRRAVHAVPGELNEEAIARLIQLVDDHIDTAGTVSEALGSIRWTSSDRFKSTRVSITPEGGETAIQVEEKASPRLRRIFQLMPAAWSVMIAAPMIAALDLPAAGLALGVGLSLGAGAAIGRAAWNLRSAQSGRRVERLAKRLAHEAYEASKKGLISP